MEPVSGREILSIKICFSLTYFLAISFFLVSILAQGLGELIVLRDPTKANGAERVLTCVSEDDDAALIWNYNSVLVRINGMQNGFTDFEPKKPPSDTVPKCAIWDSTQCLAEWVNTKGWGIVNSVEKPMEPVLDYRWEDFEEFVVGQDKEKEKYRYVKQVYATTETVVFSIRGLRGVSIQLCEKKKPKNGQCFKIVFGSSSNEQSEIFTCSRGERCENVTNVAVCGDHLILIKDRNGGVLDLYTWRTFTLKWNSSKKIVQVFNDADPENKPFLQGTLNEWHNVFHILVKSKIMARVRFHFYDYYMTEKNNSVLYSKEFNHEGKNFCVELQVGLCPECELHVYVAEAGSVAHTFENIATISGTEKSFYNKLLTWRSVKLMADISFKQFSLRVETILKGSGSGQWAIQNFRMCKPVGSLRESTLTTQRENSPLQWPIVWCQKLSNGKIDLVDSNFKGPTNDTSQLQRLVNSRSSSCGSSCEKLGKYWYICNSAGCTCDRGFHGEDCNQECMQGFHGFNCIDKCGSCQNGFCNTKTGDCSGNCTRNDLLPPLCKTAEKITNIRSITTSSISHIEVTLQWNPAQSLSGKIDGYVVLIKIDKLMGCSDLGRPTPEQKEIQRNVRDTSLTVSGLHPYANYTATVTAYNEITRESPGTVTFQTFETNIPTSNVSNFRFNQHNGGLLWDDPVDCTTITGPTKWKRLLFTGVSESVKHYKGTEQTAFQYFELKNLGKLIPYTEYRVRIHVIRDEQGAVNPACYAELEWRTPPAIPSQPRNLTASPEDHGIVKLEWAHPLMSYTKIVRFEILVEVLGRTRLSENIATRFPLLKVHVVSKEEKNYIENLYLPTSTSYRISVMATNENNVNSSRVQVNITVGDGVAFDGELNVTRNGTLINLIVPGVTNKTRETMVSVVVEGVLKCNEKPQSSLVISTYKPTNREPARFMIDPNDLHGNASSCSLDIGKHWEFKVVAKDSDSVLADLMLVPMSLVEDKPQSLVWFIISAIIIIAIFSATLLYIWHLKRKRVPAQDSYAEIIPLSQRKPSTKRSTEKLTSSCDRQSSTPPPSNYENENRLSNHVYAVPFVLESNSVNTKCFEEYAKDSASNEVLISQYGLFPRGLVRPCDYGRRPQNMPKNRSKNLIAYDESRVILDKIPGDHYSDYINANYIQGYGEASAYIATQGPKPNTINDFWRMIWQKKVLVICMLTNTVENGREMCEKYWPDVKTEEKYGEITVFNTDDQVFADYTFRTFKLNYKDYETRTVTHLHYTGWPDHDVPMYPQSVVSYLKKLAEILDGRGPMVVHCSAGDGRTGTIILCDMCIRQGIEEGKIEVSDVTNRMHSSRANMIDSPQQYVFAHVIIAESIMSIPTQIPCTDVLPSRIISLKKQLPAHVHRLNKSIWQERALQSLGSQQGRISSSMAGKKLPELIEDSVEVDIYEPCSDFDRETNYMNAVPVDGVRMKNQYLCTPLPSPSGLPDFWRFIAERNIELVIILQCPDTSDPMFCDVMPGESILVPVANMQVETETHQNEGDLFTIDKLLVTDTSEKKPRPRSVSVMTCNGWGCGKTGKLPATTALVSLWRAAENITREQGLTLVLCQDGVTGCGLYLALSFLLERMTVERECDVISAVRAVRRSRPEFVQSMEQFKYLYDAAMNYFECFQTYANFS